MTARALKDRISFKDKYTYQSQFGSRGTQPGQFENAIASIAVDPISGNIFVGEEGPTPSTSGKIHVFKADGTYIRAFPTPHLQLPEEIAIDLFGNVLVIHRFDQRVLIFNETGRLLSKFGSRGDKNGEFQGIGGIALNGDGNILICDYRDSRVQRFTGQGAFMSTPVRWKQNDAKGFISMACETSSGNIYVCDAEFGNECIRIFNAEGRFIRQTLLRTSPAERNSSWIRVLADRNGRMAVIGEGDEKVHIVSAGGQPIHQVGTYGDLNGQFRSPIGIAVDSNGNLLVADRYNFRIQAFG